MTEIGAPPEDEAADSAARRDSGAVTATTDAPGAPQAPPPPPQSPWSPGPWTPQPRDPGLPSSAWPVPPSSSPPPPGSGGGWSPPPWGQWAPPPWAPPPKPPARPAGWLVGAAVLLVAAGAAGGSGIALALRSNSSSPLISPSTTGQSPNQSLAPLPTPATGSTSGGRSIDTNAIAAKVDPAVVDVNVTTASGTAEGTGMVLTSSGEVLTNNHVVEGADSVTVQINGAGAQIPADVIGVDPTDDVALLQLSGVSGLATVSIGNSSNVQVGDEIAAIGNALGQGGTPAITIGTVSDLNQTITASDTNGANAETLNGMIQVKANIQPGDSGGPIVNSSGQVIGMTTAGSAQARRSGTVGFAIPINKALSIAQQIQSGSGPNIQPGHRGILGVIVNGGPSAVTGAPVTQVQTDSPAAKAGIAGGAVITSVDGQNVDSATTLGKLLQSKRPGETVKIGWTDASGQAHTASITLEPGPPA